MMRNALYSVVLAWVLAAAPAWAVECYVEGGLGAAFFQSTTDDGTWRQNDVQRPNNRLMDRTWTAGAGCRLNERWSVQAHYFDWGENVTKSRFASDEDYYSGACKISCTATFSRVVDRMRGYDLSVSRYWPVTDVLEVYLKGGGAIAFHELKWGDGNTYGPTRVHGTIPMLVVGGGLCYGYVCADTTLYQGTLSMNGGCIGGEYDCGYPLSKQVIVSTVLVKIPVPWGRP